MITRKVRSLFKQNDTKRPHRHNCPAQQVVSQVWPARLPSRAQYMIPTGKRAKGKLIKIWLTKKITIEENHSPLTIHTPSYLIHPHSLQINFQVLKILWIIIFMINFIIGHHCDTTLDQRYCVIRCYFVKEIFAMEYIKL